MKKLPRGIFFGSAQPNSGQALLVILLIMAVVLTISLAIVSRSVTDVRISQQEEETARAFAAAEAGIEQALVGGPSTYEVGDLQAHVSQDTQGEETTFVFPTEVDEGSTQTVWLIEHDGSGTPDPLEPGRYNGGAIDLFWGNPGAGGITPALESTLVYRSGGSLAAIKSVFDPDNGRAASNGFESAESSGPYSMSGEDFEFRRQGFQMPPGSTPYALRLKLLYSNDQTHILGVADEGLNQNFPTQGSCFESCSTVTESDITRCVQKCQFHGSPPGIFDYVLFSESDLIK